MTRVSLPYQVDDLSALARSLARQIADARVAPVAAQPDTLAPDTPSHLELMNMLARGAGFRNFQHFRASAIAGHKLAEPATQADMLKVTQALRYFNGAGHMARWPGKTHLQELCLWVLWSRLPKGQTMTEREISAALNQWHLFGDAAILRRMLWTLRMVSRSADGREYLRIEQRPPSDAVALIRAVAAPG